MRTKVLNFKLIFINLYRADDFLKKPNKIQNGALSSYGEITKKANQRRIKQAKFNSSEKYCQNKLSQKVIIQRSDNEKSFVVLGKSPWVNFDITKNLIDEGMLDQNFKAIVQE